MSGLALISAAATLIAAPAGVTTAATCHILPSSVVSSQVTKRGVSPEDIATLRDIGTPNIPSTRDRLFTLSPDGHRMAFQIRQADVASNRYCLAMVVIDLDKPDSPIVVDQGGEFLPYPLSSFGIADNPPSGLPATITPLWSADGRWIAYLRQENGTAQVWRARADGTGAEQVTHLPFNVEAFAWTDDGQGVVVGGRPGIDRFNRDVETEGLSGYRYDERTMPSVRSRPIAREPIETEFFKVTLSTGAVVEATVGERARADPPTVSPQVPGASWFVKDQAGNTAWVSPLRPDDVSAPTVLHMRYAGKSERVCVEVICQGVQDFWFDGATGDLFYLRYFRGEADEQFYRWAVGAKQPDLLWRTENRFASCQMSRNGLVCTVDEMTRPRRIVKLDLYSLHMTTVFDPNPEFATLRKGEVQLLRWTNAYGVESFGHLVLPPDHKPGDKHPLVVVGYNSLGFLRGGTGDEYPILALAEKGFAVLNYQTPVDVGFKKGAKTWEEVRRINGVDWQEYRNTVSSIDTGVDAAVATGAIDPGKIGLTGMSFGGSVAQFALVNSRRFSAAILSSCCEEASVATMFAGPGFAKTLHDGGYPRLIDDANAFWKPMSFRLNAMTMTTPTLFQIPDREFLGALESITALQEAGQPIDVYTFPNEMHVKWQPVHRLAVYRRGIQWFDFWLRGKEDLDPVQPNQYQVWRQLRH